MSCGMVWGGEVLGDVGFKVRDGVVLSKATLGRAGDAGEGRGQTGLWS